MFRSDTVLPAEAIESPWIHRPGNRSGEQKPVFGQENMQQRSASAGRFWIENRTTQRPMGFSEFSRG
jgi:hypothetical protein